jgi:hypothetical protein
VIGTDHNGGLLEITAEDQKRHVFVCGATGAGKTSLLLAQIANVAAGKGGCLFVDGKGDKEALNGVYAILAKCGRQDDLYVVDLASPRGSGAQTHTFNPVGRARASTMSDLVISMMEETGGEGLMWKARAVGLIQVVCKVVAYLRSEGVLDARFWAIRDFLHLRKLIDVADEKQFPHLDPSLRHSVREYLQTIPGFVFEKGYKQAQTVLDQHGYLSMQFFRITNAMCDDYGHIFDNGLGDFSLAEIVENKRILVVLLPTAGRSAENVAFAGMTVVALLRELMGLMTERKTSVGDEAPFHVILDEFGQYVLPGVEDIVSMARAVGMRLTFATQTTLPTRRDPNNVVMRHVLANTKVKILMRSDYLDAECMDRIAPSTAAVDRRISDLRASMDHAAKKVDMAKLLGNGDKLPGLVRKYEVMSDEHDSLTGLRDEGDLARVLPGLEPGEMIVVSGGKTVRGRAFDMSTLPRDSEFPLVQRVRFSRENIAFEVEGESLGLWNLKTAEKMPDSAAAMLAGADERMDVEDAIMRSVAACHAMAEDMEGVAK